MKKVVALLLTAIMMFAICSTAFAEESTGTVTYDANVTLYKDAACTSTSMGNKGIDNPALVTVDKDGNASILLYTHQFTYFGVKGALTAMTLDGNPGVEQGTGTYDYLVSGLSASQVAAGSVIAGTFTVEVLSTHSAKIGYLKINSLTAK